LYVADALLEPPAALGAGAFDLVVGNPPFVNGIEGHFDPGLKRRLRERFPAVRGAADLAHFFLHRAAEWVRPGGRLAFVLPRSVLNSPAARHVRASLPAHLRPNLIYAPDRCDFFPGAAVFVCLLVLGPDEQCLVSTDLEPAAATFHPVTVTGDNWWRAAIGAASRAHSGATVGEVFSVAASMTAGDAYDLLPHLVDDAHGAGPKLVTTGLIEPRESRWGRKRCRYLKRDFTHPRVAAGAALTRSLAARVANARRPKVLVAGLARRMEAWLDAGGEAVGAVGTFSIYHPADDVAALGRLLDHLLSPAATAHLIEHLGANAMRGRHITVKREFLRGLPMEIGEPNPVWALKPEGR
jgi:hypothetical protein